MKITRLHIANRCWLLPRLLGLVAILHCLLIVLALTSAIVLADENAQPESARQVMEESVGLKGGYITSLTTDQQGNIWVGEEVKGLWRFRATPGEGGAAKQWAQFTTKNGLGDNSVYAVACDRLGRIWVGHLNHGVSVYNGREWKNYDVTQGPCGERVFAIATCPTDGDVWIATNDGLTRYSLKGDNWSNYTRANGLPSDQISAIAFDSAGNLYVGTQCQGIAMASAGDNYQTWRTVHGPATMPLTASGQGLPSDLINDVLVARNGTVYAATSCGLAWSQDAGQNWNYIRGQDWQMRVKGLRGTSGPSANQPAATPVSGDLLLEDYVTCLSEDSAGMLWIGYRRQGYEARQQDAKTGQQDAGKRLYSSPNIGAAATSPLSSHADYVRAILPRLGQSSLVGRYGTPSGGLVAAGQSVAPDTAQPEQGTTQQRTTLQAGTPPVATLPVAPLPSPVSSASISTLQSMSKFILSLRRTLAPGSGAYLGEDWTTQGNWVGHYGRQYALLCAARSPLDSDVATLPLVSPSGSIGQNSNEREVSAETPLNSYLFNQPVKGESKGETPLPLDHYFITDGGYRVQGEPGPHFPPGGGVLHRINALTSSDQRMLYDPALGLRRDMSWDDNGLDYPVNRDGPDLILTVEVPEGTHRLSLYFCNSSLRTGGSGPRYLDYLVELKPYRGNILDAAVLPALANTRVTDYSGGVYKQFVVCGPSKFYVRVAKNGSPHTMLQAVFLDRLLSPPASTASPAKTVKREPALPWLGRITYAAPPLPTIKEGNLSPLVRAALAVWTSVDESQGQEGVAALQGAARLAAYRAVASEAGRATTPNKDLNAILANWRWQMNLWDNRDRREFEQKMLQGWQSFQSINPNPQAGTASGKGGITISWDAAKQGGFVVSLTRDQRGRIWAGTEDNGIWCFDPTAKQGSGWKQFTTKDGLGDNDAYALCVDKAGRVWAGHLNHGVSVWNGQKWRNYSVLQGPLGERVSDITAAPNGDVWIATNAGITLYMAKTDRWRQFTPDDGLPSCGICRVACDNSGTVYAGTQADGIVIASSTDDYKTWHAARGPRKDEVLPTPWGSGLPSNLINDITIAADGTVYASTTSGLARSADHGATWSYIRGADWSDKSKGLRVPPTSDLPNGGDGVLREDYVTCLAADTSGRVWIGYRQQGFEARRPDQQFAPEKAPLHLVSPEGFEPTTLPYVSRVLPLTDNAALVATYGEGLKLTTFSADGQSPSALPASAGAVENNSTAFPPLPSPLSAPSTEELTELLKQISAVKVVPGDEKFVTAVPDDWNTQGDWLGRYGRYYVRLCAMLSPNDYIWGAGEQKIDYAARMGPNADDDDSLRYWLQSLYTDNPSTLEMPQIYYHSRVLKGLAPQGKKMNRRQAEIDDHGEAYPMTKDGPHEYVTLTIPGGVYWLSLYDFNDNGHTGVNRLRDYRVSVRSHPDAASLSDIDSFYAQPELAHARIQSFWGGVYKRFLVRGPQTLTVEINRNYSLNAVLDGVFVDEMNEEPTPYFQTKDTTSSSAAGSMSGLTSDDAKAANELWRALERVKVQNPGWWAQNGREAYARLALWLENARSGTPASDTPHLYTRLGTCYAALNLFPQWEEMQRKRGLTPAREIEKALRWNGQMHDEAGKGRELITAYLSAKDNLAFLNSLQNQPTKNP